MKRLVITTLKIILAGKITVMIIMMVIITVTVLVI